MHTWLLSGLTSIYIGDVGKLTPSQPPKPVSGRDKIQHITVRPDCLGYTSWLVSRFVRLKQVEGKVFSNEVVAIVNNILGTR